VKQSYASKSRYPKMMLSGEVNLFNSKKTIKLRANTCLTFRVVRKVIGDAEMVKNRRCTNKDGILGLVSGTHES
jgi:hypothetical protein